MSDRISTETASLHDLRQGLMEFRENMNLINQEFIGYFSEVNEQIRVGLDRKMREIERKQNERIRDPGSGRFDVAVESDVRLEADRDELEEIKRQIENYSNAKDVFLQALSFFVTEEGGNAVNAAASLSRCISILEDYLNMDITPDEAQYTKHR